MNGSMHDYCRQIMTNGVHAAHMLCNLMDLYYSRCSAAIVCEATAYLDGMCEGHCYTT